MPDTTPLPLSRELAEEIHNFDIHESPYVFKRTAYADMIDARVRPLTRLLNCCAGYLMGQIACHPEAAGAQELLAEITAALKSAGAE